jgi:hypothetical protein
VDRLRTAAVGAEDAVQEISPAGVEGYARLTWPRRWPFRAASLGLMMFAGLASPSGNRGRSASDRGLRLPIATLFASTLLSGRISRVRFVPVGDERERRADAGSDVVTLRPGAP